MTQERSASFRPHHRIRASAEFAYCKEHGRRSYTKRLICLVCENPFSYPRLGLIVTKKTGSAIVRNRWKRVIRDYFRNHLAQFQPGRDYVLIVKSSVKGKPTRDCKAELEQLVRLSGKR